MVTLHFCKANVSGRTEKGGGGIGNHIVEGGRRFEEKESLAEVLLVEVTSIQSRSRLVVEVAEKTISVVVSIDRSWLPLLRIKAVVVSRGSKL